MRGLAHSKRSTAPSNGMDAKSSAGVPLSSPAAAQRCAEGAGLDSGAPAAAQSAMLSIALPATAPTADHLSTNAAAPAAPQLQSRISTSLTDVTTVGRTLTFEEANPTMLVPLVTATTFDAILIFHESTHGLMGSCVYKPRLFDATTIDRLLRDFQSVLEQMVTQPERPITAIRVPMNEKPLKPPLRA